MATSKGKKLEIVPLMNTAVGTKTEQMEILFKSWENCKRCHLGEIRESDKQIVFGDGNPDSQVLIVGEAPGEQEERTGIPFFGPSGEILNTILASTSGDKDAVQLVQWFQKAPHSPANVNAFRTKMIEWRRERMFVTNAVGCRPPDNRTPTPNEVKACWERIWNIIYIMDPILIIAVGKTAFEAVLRKRVTEILRSRGQIFDAAYPGRVGTLTYPVMPTLHPSFLMRIADWKDNNGNYAKTVEDFRNAFSYIDFVRHNHFGTPMPNRRVQ